MSILIGNNVTGHRGCVHIAKVYLLNLFTALSSMLEQ